MKTRTKSALVILVTLIVGILIGVLASSTINTMQQERLRDLRRRDGFASALIKTIIPQDSLQQADIRRVIEESGERMNDVRRQYYRELRGEVDSLKSELKPILSEEQQARLDEWFSRDRRRRSERSTRESQSSQDPEGRRNRSSDN